MEETPNPQCVGREFVRQYYTMLNKAPIQMHRFYSENSSFVHGMGNGESSAVYGQQQIHARIMKLQYRDCHAKIRQVDSHSTLSNGVVVQVSGELSNNGMPMRKFMQTFVLAPLAPKNYYVHNDIFMYQDEVFSDEETPEDSTPAEVDQDVPSQVKQHTEEMATTTINDTEETNLNDTPEDITTSWAASEPEMINQSGPCEDNVVAPVSHPTLIHDDSPPPSPPPEMQANLPNEEVAMVNKDPAEPEIMSPISDTPLYEDQVMDRQSPEPGDMKQAETVSNEPKSFASMLKAGNVANFTSPQNQTSPYVAAPPVRNEGFGQPAPARVQRPRPPTNNHNQRPEPPRGGENRLYRGYNDEGPRGGENDFGRRSMGAGGQTSSQFYNDRQQVFVGNLPLSVTEDDLRGVFDKFGKIVDCHINNKPKPSLSSGQKPPNFGFVIFEDVKSVQQVLESSTLYLGNNRLNVEEKKTRSMARPPSMDGRLGGSRDGGRGGGGGGGMSQRMSSGGVGPRGGRGGRVAPANRGGTYNNQRLK